MVFIHLALFSCLHSAEADIQALNTRRAWVIDQLSALIRNGAIPKSDAWIQTILDWLAVHGLFIIAKKSEKSTISAVSFTPSSFSSLPCTPRVFMPPHVRAPETLHAQHPSGLSLPVWRLGFMAVAVATEICR